MRQTRHDPMFGSDDGTAILLEAIVRLLWLSVRTVGALVISAIRHPVLAGVVATSVLTERTFGPVAVMCLILALGLILLVWWIAFRDSFQRLIQTRFSAALRGPWYRFRWPRVASRHGLIAYDHASRRNHASGGSVPEVRRIRVAAMGSHRLLLRLPVGLTPNDIQAKADGIAHAFRCREVRVLEAKPGHVWLELHRRDALSATVLPLSNSAVDLDAVPLGIQEDGSTWSLRVRGTHVLIAGATGAGKGSVLWSLLHAAGPAIASRTVEVWAIDPKGGMELRPGRPLFSRFEDGDPEAMCRLLEDLVRIKDERARDLARRSIRTHIASPSSPHIMMIVDELATLTAFAERATVRRIEQSMGLILTQGRACGISVVAAVQDPGKDVVVWRDLFPTRVAMRLDNPIQVDMVLGDGARDGGATADHISELTPGVAYVRVEGTRALRRVRAAYLDDEGVADLAVKRRPPQAVPSEAAREEGEVA